MWTYADQVQSNLDFIGSDSTGAGKRDARRAAQDGLRELSNFREWACFKSDAQFTTVAPYTIGTIQYVHDNEETNRRFEVTLTDGVWPDWARFGSLLIGIQDYQVAEVISDTVLTLSANTNPGADIAAGTAYTLYRDMYPLPTNCKSIDVLACRQRNIVLSCISVHDWLMHRQIYRVPSAPFWFTLEDDPSYQGTISVRLHPIPNIAETFRYVYRRQPRDINITAYENGVVSTDGVAATVTGNSLAKFNQRHVGATIRLSDDGDNVPTGDYGENPPVYEGIIMGFNRDSNTFTLDHPPDAYDSVKYQISDQIDLNPDVMLNIYKRTCEKILSGVRHMTDSAKIYNAWLTEMRIAMSADSRFMSDVISGETLGPRLPSTVSVLAAVASDKG